MAVTYRVKGNNVLKGVAEQWEKGQLCDIKLVAGGTMIAAHRNILAASSPYFESMFLGEFKESKQGTVNLKGIDPTGLELVIRCIYTEGLTLDNNVVPHVLSVAHFLQIQSIIDACEKNMISSLTDDLCFKFLQLFEKYSLPKGEKAANQYILDNFVAVSKTAPFLDIKKEDLCAYLDSEDLRINQEIEAFRAAQAWIEHDKKRILHCSDILKHIRLAFIPSKVLASEVRNVAFMKQDKTCTDLLFETFEYQTSLYSQPMHISTINKPRGTASILVIEAGTRKSEDGQDLLTITEQENPAWIVKLDDTSHIHKQINIGIPFVFGSVSIIEYNNFIYLLGVDGRSFSNVTMRYDANTNQWMVLAPIPSSALTKYAVARVDNKIIVTSGRYLTSKNGTQVHLHRKDVTDTTHSYDIESNKWTQVAKFPTQLVSAKGCGHSGLMYVAGGLNLSTPTLIINQRMWAYDIKGDVWLKKPKVNELIMSTTFFHPIGDKLLLFGPVFDTLHIFDIAQNQWSEINVNADLSFFSCSACLDDSRVVVLGGDRSEIVAVTTYGFQILGNTFPKCVKYNYSVVLKQM